MNTFSHRTRQDNCCHGWRVDIDADSYERLKTAASFSAKPIRKKLMQLIKITDPPTTRSSAGHRKDGEPGQATQDQAVILFKLDDEGCHFQTEELCEIHSHWRWLPVVCATYPVNSRSGKHFEPRPSSCPEVSQLLHDDAADEVELDLPGSLGLATA